MIALTDHTNQYIVMTGQQMTRHRPSEMCIRPRPGSAQCRETEHLPEGSREQVACDCGQEPLPRPWGPPLGLRSPAHTPTGVGCQPPGLGRPSALGWFFFFVVCSGKIVKVPSKVKIVFGELTEILVRC